jgi:hypothetical protein
MHAAKHAHEPAPSDERAVLFSAVAVSVVTAHRKRMHCSHAKPHWAIKARKKLPISGAGSGQRAWLMFLPILAALVVDEPHRPVVFASE